MTARKIQTSRPVHQQERPSKDLLLNLLANRGPQTVAQLAKDACMAPRCARGHLELLRTYGEAFRIEGTSPIIWANKPMALNELPRLSADEVEQNYSRRTRRDAKFDDSFSMPVIKRMIPAGQWRIDHPVAPASIFSMGAV